MARETVLTPEGLEDLKAKIERVSRAIEEQNTEIDTVNEADFRGNDETFIR